MGFIWHEVRSGIPLIVAGNGYILAVTWVTIRVASVSTAAALVIGLPIGLTLGLGRFRGRRALHLLANAGLALPPVIVGVFVLLLRSRRAPSALCTTRSPSRRCTSRRPCSPSRTSSR